MDNKPIIFKSQLRDVVLGVNVKIVEPVNIYECIMVIIHLLDLLLKSKRMSNW